MAEVAETDNFNQEPVDTEDLRERMQGLLEYVLGYYELHPDEGEENA